MGRSPALQPFRRCSTVHPTRQRPASIGQRCACGGGPQPLAPATCQRPGARGRPFPDRSSGLLQGDQQCAAEFDREVDS
eukprot:8820213-Pyramimonas_sp.AAC.1